MEEESSAAEKEYEEFQEKVKRTVYLDNLSPVVTPSIVTTALDQFGTVKNVHFLPNYEETGKNVPQKALVEMENEKMAKAVVAEMTNNPFMMVGKPRPVRGFAAVAEMFDDRPPKPNRMIQVKWIKPSDLNFEQEIKALTERHRAEAEFLLKLQKEREEQLHQAQAAVLVANHKKFDSIDNLWSDGTVYRFGEEFGLNVKNEV